MCPPPALAPRNRISNYYVKRFLSVGEVVDRRDKSSATSGNIWGLGCVTAAFTIRVPAAATGMATSLQFEID